MLTDLLIQITKDDRRINVELDVLFCFCTALLFTLISKSVNRFIPYLLVDNFDMHTWGMHLVLLYVRFAINECEIVWNLLTQMECIYLRIFLMSNKCSNVNCVSTYQSGDDILFFNCWLINRQILNKILMKPMKAQSRDGSFHLKIFHVPMI